MTTPQEEEAIDKILDGCKLMGWHIAAQFEVKEGTTGDEPLDGLVIGTREYIEEIFQISKSKSDG